MDVVVQETPLPGVKIVTPQAFEDERGFFVEVFREDIHAAAGLPTDYVQLNHSRSARGVLRGLHFQWNPPMGKLMRVLQGEAFLVAVDIRKGSPTLGKWYGKRVTAASREMLWAPASFARGFCVLSESAEIEYLCTGVYNAKAESGIAWNDPRIGIDWPIGDPTLSAKDANAQSLEAWLARPESSHFTYGGPNS